MAQRAQSGPEGPEWPRGPRMAHGTQYDPGGPELFTWPRNNKKSLYLKISETQFFLGHPVYCQKQKGARMEITFKVFRNLKSKMGDCPTTSTVRSIISYQDYIVEIIHVLVECPINVH